MCFKIHLGFVWKIFWHCRLPQTRQNNFFELSLCQIKKSEYRVTIPFHLKEVFQNPFGFCSENIWTVPSSLKSNNLEELGFPAVMKKDGINGKPYVSILLQKRCSEKRSENGQIHSGISEWNLSTSFIKTCKYIQAYSFFVTITFSFRLTHFSLQSHYNWGNPFFDKV